MFGEPKSWDRIEKDLLDEQLEGEPDGSIRLLVDVRKKKIYSVDPDSFHSVLAATLLGMGNVEKLRKNPQAASHLILTM